MSFSCHREHCIRRRCKPTRMLTCTISHRAHVDPDDDLEKRYAIAHSVDPTYDPVEPDHVIPVLPIYKEHSSINHPVYASPTLLEREDEKPYLNPYLEPDVLSEVDYAHPNHTVGDGKSTSSDDDRRQHQPHQVQHAGSQPRTQTQQKHCLHGDTVFSGLDCESNTPHMPSAPTSMISTDVADSQQPPATKNDIETDTPPSKTSLSPQIPSELLPQVLKVPVGEPIPTPPPHTSIKSFPPPHTSMTSAQLKTLQDEWEPGVGDYDVGTSVSPAGLLHFEMGSLTGYTVATPSNEEMLLAKKRESQWCVAESWMQLDCQPSRTEIEDWLEGEVLGTYMISDNGKLVLSVKATAVGVIHFTILQRRGKFTLQNCPQQQPSFISLRGMLRFYDMNNPANFDNGVDLRECLEPPIECGC